MKLTELLFKRKPTVIECASRSTDNPDTAFTTGMTITEHSGYAKETRKMAKATSAGAPKLSSIAVLFDRLLINRCLYLAVVNENQGYAEYTAEDGTVYASLCDGKSVKWLNGNKPTTGYCAFLASPFAYAYANNDEVKTSVEKALMFADVIDATECVAPQSLFKACDAFYYGFAYDKATEEFPDNDTLTEEELRQCVRTHNYEPIFEAGTKSVYLSDFASASEEGTPVSEELEAIKRGEYFVGYNWNEDQMERIPALSTLDKFVPGEDFYSLFDMISDTAEKCLAAMDEGINGVDVIGKGGYVNTIMVGKPGTGKTTIAYALGAALGLPVYTVVNSRNTEEDNFEGKTKVVEGKIQSVSTPFLEAYKNGGIIVLEEFNLIAPDVIMGALGQAVEAPFILMEDGYTEVRRHPLCFIIATMNTCTQGSKEPNEAFTSRFPDVFLLDDPEERAFIEILKSTGSEEEVCRKVYTAYTSVLDYLKSIDETSVAMSITLRHCLAALKAIKRGLSTKAAIKRTMINPIGIKDLELAEQVYSTVIEPLKF